MTTAAVKKMMLSTFDTALRENDGVITGDEYKKIIDYAKRGWLTSGEKRALLEPSSYIGTKFSSEELRRIKFDESAYALAKSFAEEHSFDSFLSNFKNVQSSAAPPRPETPTAVTNVAEAYLNALNKGRDLGEFDSWKVTTPGAEISFKVDVMGRKWPAMVMDTVKFTDPTPKELLKGQGDALAAVSDVVGFRGLAEQILADNADHFGAKDQVSESKNQQYGIRNLRRQAFLTELRDGISSTGLSLEDKVNAKGVIEGLALSMVSGQDFNMDVGSHTNYWPYWENYSGPMEKLLDQETPGSDGQKQIKNRLSDIYRRKTAKSRNVNERDFERTAGYSFVYSPQYSLGAGHRVSMTEDSGPLKPAYELLSVRSEGLPEDLQKYAGLQLVRDTDSNKTIRFDYMGDGDTTAAKLAREMTGKEIPVGLKNFVASKEIDAFSDDNFTLRAMAKGERTRGNFSVDWDGNGSINIANTYIGWWGHCHNEAPLNAMAVDPQKKVTLYRAGGAVSEDKATKTYSTEDVWDLVGSSVAGQEDGWVAGRDRTRVDETSFVGVRNDGKHTLALTLTNGKTVKLDGELNSLLKGGEQIDPKAVFRPSLPSDDGTFSKNLNYVSSSAREADLVTIDVRNASMTLSVDYYTLNENGYPVKQNMGLAIDPEKDEFVKVNEEIAERDRVSGQGGEIKEHFYNPKTGEYYSVLYGVSKDNNYERRELSRTDKAEVIGLTHESETEYDSAKEIFQYFMENPGLPKTYDTSSDKAVWNYPVNREKLTLEKEVTKEENGQNFTYRTVRLQYDTMGGPSGDSSFILKYNSAGAIVDTCALDPMPDFAFRNDHWVSGPVALDVNGKTSYNVKALNQGYLVKEGGTSFDDIETTLWKRMSTVIYAGLSDRTAAGHAYIFESAEGKIYSFADQTDFDAAVAADRDVRRADAEVVN